MKYVLFLVLSLILALPVEAQQAAEPPIAIVVHGGAGTMRRGRITPEMDSLYRAKLAEAARTGHAILEAGGSAQQAVVATIQVLESSWLFNAGIGAVSTAEGKYELDASIMHGGTGLAGAVAGATRIKSPIAAAVAVMERTPHVMIAGPGANTFADTAGLDMVDNTYFARPDADDQGSLAPYYEQIDRLNKLGTVGCVALDKDGNIVAGTSTGGMQGKMPGRVGDAPIIGAATYADNGTCGISATGHGEYFIRNAVAFHISALMRYAGEPLRAAARTVIFDILNADAGGGGVIGLDAQGTIMMEFNTPGMFRAAIDKDGKLYVGIYAGE